MIATLMMVNKFVDEYVSMLISLYACPNTVSKQPRSHEQDLVQRFWHSSQGGQQDGT